MRKDKLYVTRPLLPNLEKIHKQLEDIWESGFITNNGLKLKELEDKLQLRLDVPHLSAFSNGTLALMVAIQALRLSGEVITVPFTFPATVHSLIWNNISPVFCDIGEDMNIDINKIESCITKDTTAILPVHIFGNPCDISAIDEIASIHHLQVIYDAAHCFGVKYKNKGIGNYGDITMFSFHATKLFHTAEGGALSTKNTELRKRIDYLKNFGYQDEEIVVMPGINGKMSEIHAILGLEVLKLVDEEIERRKILYLQYKKQLQNIPNILLPAINKEVEHNYQYFPIRIISRTRDIVRKKLLERNIISRKYFYPLCSEFPFYRFLPSSSQVPTATKISRECLVLPLFGRMIEEDVTEICEIVKEIS